MASASSSSSKFMRLAGAFRLLCHRSDIDNILLELLGQFSLEKIYSEADKNVYQTLVINLVVQLDVIFKIQRLSLPVEGVQVGRYLGHLASWEVSLRTVEFVLQVVVEGREILFEARLLRDKYLAELLLDVLRFLTFHPKVPSPQRIKDRRDRFNRIHRLLERVFDGYPGPESFLLTVCKEITEYLRNDPDSFILPLKLRTELPSLTTDQFYPLPSCLQSEYVSTIISPHSHPRDWLSQFLVLRDISLYVVGASVQYTSNRESRDVRLQSSSARTRNQVLRALEHIHLPENISRVELMTTLNDIFRTILPDALNIGRIHGLEESHIDEAEIDAIDIFCTKLTNRQMLNRVNDKEMIKRISKITRNIEVIDDPNGHHGVDQPKVYSMNCTKCHLVGDTQMRYDEGLRFPVELKIPEVVLPLRTKCPVCRESVSMMRELTLIRETWESLKPLELNADTIDIERHLNTQFHLFPPRLETGIASYNFSGTQKSPAMDYYSPPHSQHSLSDMVFTNRSRSLPQSLLSLSPTTSYQPSDASRTEVPSHHFSAISTTSSKATSRFTELLMKSTATSIDSPLSPGLKMNEVGSSLRLASVSNVTPDTDSMGRKGLIALDTPPDKGKSKWRSKLTVSRKESTKGSYDSSSSTSSTLETQKLEAVSLKTLMSVSKGYSKGKNIKSINVNLSHNSTYALFWTQSILNVWDVSTSPPILVRALSPESTCLLVAVTKVHLAYIMGTSNQKLTLRIVNLVRAGVPAVEYRMPSSPWCHSICIDPKENYVVVGFDKATVRFFKTARSEEPREEKLHSRYANHKDCKNCSPVDAISFSIDGLNVLASTRSMKNGMIQIYTWRFPFEDFAELASCRYHVPLHESEDNGISAAIFRTGQVGEENLVCITTWTQSGIPILVQPQDGHRCEVKTDISGHQGKLGSRIQCAAFSPSGRELAMINHNGHLYYISSLNSSPLDVRRIATSKELTARSNCFAMSFMQISDQMFIVLAWADPCKEVGYIKKIPVKPSERNDGPLTSTPTTLPASPTPRYELPTADREIPREPVEMGISVPLPTFPAPLNVIKGYPNEKT